MLRIENDTVLVDRDSTKLIGYRLEDTIRAPAIIVFVDEEKPELLPLRQGQTPPSRIRSRNMEAEIQIITYSELSEYLA